MLVTDMYLFHVIVEFYNVNYKERKEKNLHCNSTLNQSKDAYKHLQKLEQTRSTTAVDPRHLKVKEKDISPTQNYCITVSIQIISSIYILILKIQHLLESC